MKILINVTIFDMKFTYTYTVLKVVKKR